LVQALEKRGIGRPSTYASTLATLKVRGYIEVGRERKLIPTARGLVICDFLTAQFPSLFADDFTAQLENDLDAIAEGKADGVAVLRRFWQTMEPYIQAAESIAHPVDQHQTTTREACPMCGQPLTHRKGKNGVFLGCSGYPDCRYTRPVDEVKSRSRSSVKRRKTR
jgi:DNA topoisomerase-1